MANDTKPKPDDRSDNVEKIEYNIGQTIRNMELAEEMIEKTDDEKMKKELKEKKQEKRRCASWDKRRNQR